MVETKEYNIMRQGMEEYFATERNCHQLTDNYDKRVMKLDGAESPQNRLYVVFSHGKESGPFGRKIQGLMAVAEEIGLNTTSVDYRQCADAKDRVNLLHQTLSQLDIPMSRIVLVGSSMGGYVSAVVANEMPVS